MAWGCTAGQGPHRSREGVGGSPGFITPSPGLGNYSPGCHRPGLLNAHCESQGPLGSRPRRGRLGVGAGKAAEKG